MENTAVKNLVLFATAAAVLFVAPKVQAAVTCQAVYGGQSCVETGAISVDKKVQNPQTNVFVDNLGVNDPKFGPDAPIVFQITLKNTGSVALSKVTVKDVIPQFVTNVNGAGSFDATNRTVSFDVTNLQKDESRTFTLSGKIVPNGQFPGDMQTTCVVNQALATTDNGSQAQDNAQFCLQKQAAPTSGVVALPTASADGVKQLPQAPVTGLTTKGGKIVLPAKPVTKTPATGPETLPLIATAASGVLGFFLRKKAIL